MSRPMPSIQKYMTSSPLTIDKRATLEEAAKLMAEHHIRHLPVLDGGALVGVISERDVSVVQSMRESAKVPVEYAMTNAPYVVSPTTPLLEVISEMAVNKYGSVVVMHAAKVVGIFTAVDALAAFAEHLEARYRS